jgi:MoaA/NifB/PqqE/SkfB family radical SAM enzyme
VDVAVILTYRCNSKCSMCNIWQHPTLPREEISLATLDKIPYGIDYLNLTGGEPTLRRDLCEIVDLLYPRAMQLEISSNGLYPERLEPIIKKYPKIKVRLSLEGFQKTNDSIRGEKDGFNKKVAGLLRLKDLGGCDLGFAITIQDDNTKDVVELFKFAQKHGVELATSTLHNGFQFHKNDNVPYDRQRVARSIEGLIVEQLRTPSVKNWFRAYLNLGLIRKALGQHRLLPCTAASDFVFVDPWSDVYACNVRPDLKLGNLENQAWETVLDGREAKEIRRRVAACTQNCWMVGSAKTAMRYHHFAKLPKLGPMLWVLTNKTRAALGKPIPFDRYVDYSQVTKDAHVPPRVSYLNRTLQRIIETRQEAHYARFGEYFNR